MSKVGNCKRCGAPQGMIGWLCGHNGNDEHDRNEDMFWEEWHKKMEIKNNLSKKYEK